MFHFSEVGLGGPIWKCQIFIRGREKVFRQQPENKSNKYIDSKYLARQAAGLMGEYDLGGVGGLLSPRLLVEGRTIGRSGSYRFSIGTIELNFCKEIATPADKWGKPVSWTYAYSIESGKYSSTTFNGHQRSSGHSSLCPEGFSMYIPLHSQPPLNLQMNCRRNSKDIESVFLNARYHRTLNMCTFTLMKFFVHPKTKLISLTPKYNFEFGFLCSKQGAIK